METYDAVVIGGGIAGCSLAAELADRGLSVAVLERGNLAAEASGKNTGTLLNRFQPEVVEMMRVTLAMLQELNEGPVSFSLEEHDQLLVATTAEQFRQTAEKASRMSELGLRVAAVEAVDLRRDHPAFDFRVEGAFAVASAWTLDPLAATYAFAERARNRGAVFRTNIRAAQVLRQGDAVRGVLTDRGELAAKLVFLASGPWLNDLLRRSGVAAASTPPLTTGKGWLLRTGPLTVDLPWIIEELAWPEQSELGRTTQLLALTDVAEGGHDRPVVEAFVMAPTGCGDALIGASLAASLRGSVEGIDMPARLAAHALSVAPGLSALRVEDAWFGLRPMLPDGLPVAGGTAIEGLHVHGGHGSLGMQAAPATARWLARSILESRAALPAWLVPDRFTPARIQ